MNRVNRRKIPKVADRTRSRPTSAQALIAGSATRAQPTSPPHGTADHLRTSAVFSFTSPHPVILWAPFLFTSLSLSLARGPSWKRLPLRTPVPVALLTQQSSALWAWSALSALCWAPLLRPSLLRAWRSRFSPVFNPYFFTGSSYLAYKSLPSSKMPFQFCLTSCPQASLKCPSSHAPLGRWLPREPLQPDSWPPPPPCPQVALERVNDTVVFRPDLLKSVIFILVLNLSLLFTVFHLFILTFWKVDPERLWGTPHFCGRANGSEVSWVGWSTKDAALLFPRKLHPPFFQLRTFPGPPWGASVSCCFG